MHAHTHPRVKICCIASIDEAWMAIRHGASALGLVSEMPSGPGPIPEAHIAAIAAAVPPPIATFLLTSKQDPGEIIAQQRRCGASTLQLVDEIAPGGHRELRRVLPGIRLVQVIHVQDEGAIDEALALAPEVDAFLLDSGNPKLARKELGGTGRTHDWEISRRLREAVPVPVFLAGGLNPDNVAEAVRRVGPWGVDLCSGVRTEGRLDAVKLAAFFSSLGR